MRDGEKREQQSGITREFRHNRGRKIVDNGSVTIDTSISAPLEHYGMDIYNIHCAIEGYGKKKITTAAAIAHDFAREIGGELNIPYLLHCIHLLGNEASRHMIFYLGKSPRQIVEDYKIRNTRFSRVVSPRRAHVSLEAIASVADIASAFQAKGISKTHDGNGIMVFDYVQ